MMGGVRAAGAPAVLVGTREHLTIVEAYGDSAEAARLRAGLEALLERGGFALDRPTFEFYAQDFPAVARWGVWAEAARNFFAVRPSQRAGRTILSSGPPVCDGPAWS